MAPRWLAGSLSGLDDLRENAEDELAEVGLGESRKRIDALDAPSSRADDFDRSHTSGSGHWVRAEENISILGRLAMAERAIRDVAHDRWPITFDADYQLDVGISAANIAELATGLRALVDELESKTAALEESLGMPDKA